MSPSSDLFLEIQRAFPGETLKPQSLRAFPLGFFLSQDESPRQLLLIYQRQLSRRLRLALALDRLHLYPSQQVKINWPTKLEPLKAVRLLNDNLICWTNQSAYKFPRSPTSLFRMKKASQGRLALLNTPLASFIYPNQHCDLGEYIYRVGPVGRLLPLDRSSRSILDDFISSVLSWTLSEAKPNPNFDGLGVGMEHGDLHVNNVLIQNNGRLGIIDFDHTRMDGLPIIDLISFVVHFVGFYTYKDYPRALNESLSQSSQILATFKNEGFLKTSQLWEKYYRPEANRFFIINRENWINENSPEAKFFTQVNGVLSRYREQTH